MLTKIKLIGTLIIITTAIQEDFITFSVILKTYTITKTITIIISEAKELLEEIVEAIL